MTAIYSCKEANFLRIITASLNGFKFDFQYSVDGYKIDLYFIDLKLAVEVDENGHRNRSKHVELERQKYIEDKLGCEFIRFNPDEKDFNIGDTISKIFQRILKSKCR